MKEWVEDADAEQDPEEEYDRFLTKLFNAQKNRKTDCIGIESLKGMIEKGGFQFEESEYKELVQAYFRNKSEISLEEFKLFAKGQCVKLTKPTLKSLNLWLTLHLPSPTPSPITSPFLPWIVSDISQDAPQMDHPHHLQLVLWTQLLLSYVGHMTPGSR